VYINAFPGFTVYTILKLEKRNLTNISSNNGKKAMRTGKKTNKNATINETLMYFHAKD